jgi:hypothetical protein
LLWFASAQQTPHHTEYLPFAPLLLTMAAVLDYLHEIFIAGALRREWGGPKCRAYVDETTHYAEWAFWALFLAVTYWGFDMGNSARFVHKSVKAKIARMPAQPFTRTLEVCMGLFHMLIFAGLVYLKFESSTLIFMLQPCHIAVFLQGVALLSDGALGVMLGCLLLPLSTGTLLAIVLPNTPGMSALETNMFWLEHYVAQVVPIYMLTRRNFLPMKTISGFTVMFGVWLFVMPHWVLYEVSRSPVACLLTSRCVSCCPLFV